MNGCLGANKVIYESRRRVLVSDICSWRSYFEQFPTKGSIALYSMTLEILYLYARLLPVLFIQNQKSLAHYKFCN